MYRGKLTNCTFISLVALFTSISALSYNQQDQSDQTGQNTQQRVCKPDPDPVPMPKVITHTQLPGKKTVIRHIVKTTETTTTNTDVVKHQEEYRCGVDVKKEYCPEKPECYNPEEKWRTSLDNQDQNDEARQIMATEKATRDCKLAEHKHVVKDHTDVEVDTVTTVTRGIDTEEYEEVEVNEIPVTSCKQKVEIYKS